MAILGVKEGEIVPTFQANKKKEAAREKEFKKL
jgi:hypothetical protein